MGSAGSGLQMPPQSRRNPSQHCGPRPTARSGLPRGEALPEARSPTALHPSRRRWQRGRGRARPAGGVAAAARGQSAQELPGVGLPRLGAPGRGGQGGPGSQRPRRPSRAELGRARSPQPRSQVTPSVTPARSFLFLSPLRPRLPFPPPTSPQRSRRRQLRRHVGTRRVPSSGRHRPHPAQARRSRRLRSPRRPGPGAAPAER